MTGDEFLKKAYPYEEERRRNEERMRMRRELLERDDAAYRDEYGYDRYDYNRDGYVTEEDATTYFPEEGNDSLEMTGKWEKDVEEWDESDEGKKERKRDERER